MKFEGKISLYRFWDLFSCYQKDLYSVYILNRSTRTNGSEKKQVHLLSTALSDITNAGSPESPSGVMGVNFATM